MPCIYCADKSPGSIKMKILFISIFMIALFSYGALSVKADESTFSLHTILETNCEKYKVPGIAALLLTSEGIEQSAVYGVRKYKTEIPVAADDIWHLGSNTKMMTAALAAVCVNKGLIKWDTTLKEIFSSSININKGYEDVTLLSLLSHRAGMPENIDYYSLDAGRTLREQRFELTKSVITKKPYAKPESSFLYSNVGYIIAGSMLEAVCDTDFETLLKTNIFDPLKMSSAGFGGIGTPGKVDQPWGHTAPAKPYPVNGNAADNPPLIGPAGSVHCSIQDWSKFIVDQLKGARGIPGQLNAADYQFMQTAHFNDNYGLGWICVERDWADGPALTHEGNNTLFTALVWLMPEKNTAVLICTNEGKVSGKAADSIVVEILRQKGWINEFSKGRKKIGILFL